MASRRFLPVFLILFSILSFAQSSSPRHPRVGLVLEGGGALGLAHIGVIDWLEKNHVPIDYVTGTSMGGLVGGLYASGHTPEEIKKIVSDINWDDVFSDRIPYKGLSFRRKEDRRAFPNSIEFGLKRGVRFPAGFNSGQQVGLLLDRVTLPFSTLPSFDNLPIPFRCVGTDLVSRKEHVFSNGPLADALRATMSLPAIFTPVRSGDSVYVDGGLLNNLPVDVARNMGADIVVAVHLRTRTLDAKEPLSSFGVLGESISVVIAANELRSLEKADIVITIDLSTYTSTEYEKYQALIQKGFEAAAAKSAILSSLKVSESDWLAYVQNRSNRIPKAIPVPQFVQVAAEQEDLAEKLQHELSAFAGKPVNTARLDNAMDQIVGIGRFATASYTLGEKDGVPGLFIKAQGKDYAPPIVNPLIEIDGTEYRNTRFTIGARITSFDQGGVGSEWRNDFLFGSLFELRSQYYHPIRKFSPWFIAPQGILSSGPFDVYNHDTQVAQYLAQTAGYGLALGYSFGRTAQLTFGYTGGYSNFEKRIGSAVLPDFSGRFGVTTVQFLMDRMDNPIVPHKGTSLAASWQWHDAVVAGTEQFPSAELRFTIAQPIRPKDSVFFTAEGGSSLGFTNNGLPMYSLGGPQRLNAYGTNEILTNQYFLGRAGYLHQLFTLPPLIGGNFYLVGSYEFAKSYATPNAPNLPMDGNFGAIIETAFGPIYIGGSIGNADHHKFLFKMGRLF